MSESEVDDRRHQAGDAFTNVRIRRPVVRQSRWARLSLNAAHAAGAVLLLAAGTVWTLRMQHPKYLQPGGLLSLPPAVTSTTAGLVLADTNVAAPTDPQTREQVFKVSQFLRTYTKDTTHAQRIASAIVDQANKRKMNPALLVGVMLTEDAKLDPRATSSVGARGLMQVMPFHAGKHDCGSSNLFDIEANICYGADILQQMMKKSPSVATALQHYNGCVHGTNTPNCYTYSGKVLKYAEQAATKMLTFSLGD